MGRFRWGPILLAQVLEVAFLRVPVAVPSGSDLVALVPHDEAEVTHCKPHHDPYDVPLQSVLRLWRVGQSKRWSPAVVEVPVDEAWGTIVQEHVVLRSVCVTQRTDRSRLIFPACPSKKLLRGWLRTLAPDDRNLHPVEDIPRTSMARLPLSSTDPHLILDWLEATSHLKDLKKKDEATSSWARLFSRASDQNRYSLEADVEHVDSTVLRRARVRLDISAMIAFRLLFNCMFKQDAENVQLYLYCDASPQWRGLELFSSSVDMYDGTAFTRRLMPCVALGKSMLNARGKALALCWQCFLLAGLTVELVRFFLGRVRGVLTDMGTERLIVNLPDALGSLCGMLKSGHGFADVGDLFPRAVAIPG